jgi:hypothetical protein
MMTPATKGVKGEVYQLKISMLFLGYNVKGTSYLQGRAGS